MMQNKAWLKFLITGNPKDYLTYKNNSQLFDIYGGGDAEDYDRRPCDKGNKYKG